jgi:metal-responsive CopG/Arc/MetJ family transcriptional regulator
MKTAVSIPDQVFTEAEDLSKQLGVSRSQLYTKALSQLVAKYREEDIVHRLNEVYETEDSTLDPGFRRAQAPVLRPEEW